MPKKNIIGIGSLVIALSAVFLPAFAAIGPTGPTPEQLIEINFFGTMIQHNGLKGIVLAQVCIDKATHRQLKTLCQDIQNRTFRDNIKLNGWNLAWYSMEADHWSDSFHQVKVNLEALSGAEFETAVMQKLITHDTEDIDSLNECANSVSHNQLRNFCRRSLIQNKKEIKRLERWLDKWYNQ